jgi:hypothetical protein
MAQKHKPSRWDFLLWAGGLFGLAVCVWLGWQVVASTFSSSRWVVCAIALFVLLLLVFGPELFFELPARRAIRRTCQTAGEVVTKIESRKTHYRVFIQTSSGAASRKCVVHSGMVKWIT